MLHGFPSCNLLSLSHPKLSVLLSATQAKYSYPVAATKTPRDRNVRPRSSDSQLNVRVVLLQCAWLRDLEDAEIASDTTDPWKNGGNLRGYRVISSKIPQRLP